MLAWKTRNSASNVINLNPYRHFIRTRKWLMDMLINVRIATNATFKITTKAKESSIKTMNELALDSRSVNAI